jgi:hypothetical protein
MLKLPDVISQIRKAATFSFFNVQGIVDTEYVSIFMFYTYAKFHMSNFNGSLVIDVMPKTKFGSCVAAIVFYTAKTNYRLKIADNSDIYDYQTF